MTRRCIALSVLVVLCLFLAGLAVSNGKIWTSKGPRGAKGGWLVVDPTNPDILYAATFGPSPQSDPVIFKSIDAGLNWKEITNGLPLRRPMAIGIGAINCLAIVPKSPNVLYAGGSLAGVFKSTNAGEHWEEVNNGVPIIDEYARPDTISSLVIDPQNFQIIYAGTHSIGVIKTTDGGKNWRKLGQGVFSPVKHLVIEPKTPTTLYATGGSQIFKSADAGKSWTSILSKSAVHNYGDISALTIDENGTLYVGTAWRGIYKSSDSGESWSILKRGLPKHTDILHLVINPKTPAILYVVGLPLKGGLVVYRSDDDGRSWSAINNGLPNEVFIWDLVIASSSPNVLYLGTDFGIFKTINGGKIWRALQ
ncbi:MAG: hypothetical protein H8D67_07630 [Deltaproteobacteria bacterium]|nr:hypothetical protein [Deltaproteobacteria bacterium]